ncbi:AAA family ATPase [Myroides pelagicus]|uniref:AAA family ATPase n=1 Tax=Myroides pelagicus TaxID=270914 RepID=UPI002DB6C0A1|nr:AAA family ATPase [Myroides pelagicus]MEC4115070.1 AAA family ATPase [Myroides pelagicus]
MKIKRIQINNYRAFLVNNDKESARYTIDLPNGENLLIYGENGSGKSSLFRALKDFFNSALDTGLAFQKNLFYNPDDNEEQPYINIMLEDDSECSFSSETARTNTHTIPVIAKASIVKGFVGYRDLLQLHFRQYNSQPDLFSFFLGQTGLFADMILPSPLQPANKISYKDLWEKIQHTKIQGDISDYNTNVYAQFLELEDRANMLLKYFQKECDLRIEYQEMELQGEDLVLPSISLKIKLFEKELPEHEEVLNEARLTALAISVYLAYVLGLPATDLRILFLDDIFIGLDMTNRIPLLEILTKDEFDDGTSFRDFQIFLTTYDREWFNVAKSYLEGWQKTEFYVDNYNGSIDRPLIRKSDSYEERAWFYLTQGDYPACANYLRKAFEQKLRDILPENMLHSGFSRSDNDTSHIIVSKEHLSINQNDEVWFFMPKESNAKNISQSGFTGLQKLIEKFDILIKNYRINFQHTDNLNRIKNRLLNPLSHHDLRSPIFKTELETGFTILTQLNKIKTQIIVKVPNETPVYLYFDKVDANTGKDYRYQFQLLENLILLEYGEEERMLNAECKPIARFLKIDNSEEIGEGKNQRSIYNLCKGICIRSALEIEKKNVILDPDSLINKVYIETGQTLKDLL